MERPLWGSRVSSDEFLAGGLSGTAVLQRRARICWIPRGTSTWHLAVMSPQEQWSLLHFILPNLYKFLFYQLQLRPVHGRMFWEMQLPALAKLLTCNVVWCSHRNCEEARTLSVGQQGGRECITFMKKQKLMFPKKDGKNGWSSDPKLVSFRFCILELTSLFLKNLNTLSCKQTNKNTYLSKTCLQNKTV